MTVRCFHPSLLFIMASRQRKSLTVNGYPVYQFAYEGYCRFISRMEHTDKQKKGRGKNQRNLCWGIRSVPADLELKTGKNRYEKQKNFRIRTAGTKRGEESERKTGSEENSAAWCGDAAHALQILRTEYAAADALFFKNVADNNSNTKNSCINSQLSFTWILRIVFLWSDQ